MFLADPPALQDVWPHATCFGCGPSNPAGLHIKSYWSPDGSEVICTFQSKLDYNAGFENTMYGGMVASLIDCHSIWTAIATMYKREGRPHGSQPHISFVTGNLNVTYLAPTPIATPIVMRAHVQEVSTSGRKVTVHCAMYTGETKTAEAKVIAVRYQQDKSVGVQPQHGL